MEPQESRNTTAGSASTEAISAAANAAAAFNNFASTIEAIMGKLGGETPGAASTPGKVGEPGERPITLQSQINDLVTKSAALTGQVSGQGQIYRVSNTPYWASRCSLPG